MKAILAVAGLELRARRPLLLAAPLAALVPLFGPYVPGLSSVPGSEARFGLLVMVGAILPLALALGLGASALGEEVAGRRLSFFFARPLPTYAIWGGKLAVALFTPLVVATLILGSAIVVARAREGESRGLDTPWMACLLACVFLTSLAHAASGLYRSRSRWIAVDLVLAVALGSAAYRLGGYAMDAGVLGDVVNQTLGRDPRALLAVPAVLLAAACLLAGYRQVTVGRTDAAAGHLAASVALWGSLGLGLGLAGLATARFVDRPPRELVRRHVVPLSGGGPVLLGGLGGHAGVSAFPAYLMDGGDGSVRRITTGVGFPVVAPGNRHAVVVEGFVSPRLVTVSATPAGLVVTRAALEGDPSVWPICVSEDGARAVLGRGAAAEVVDTATGRRLPAGGLDQVNSCTFESPRRLVLYQNDPRRDALARRVLDLETGARGEPVLIPEARVVLAIQGDRMVGQVRGPRPTEMGLFDVGSGRLLRRLGIPTLGSFEWAAFLPEGGLAFIDAATPRTVRIYDHDGNETLAREVVERGRAAVAGVTPLGEVLVIVAEAGGPSTLVVDPRSGHVATRIDGLRPALGPGPWVGDPSTRLAQSQERFRRGLFRDAHQALVRLDPGTGQSRVLLAAAPEGPASDY